MQNHASLTRYAWLSIGAAIATISLKTAAYYLTGSVGLLSDAIESLVNLAGAVMALIMLIIAARPADESHVYGHSKAEYFASITEGILILGAAAGIISAAVARLIEPRPLEQLGIGLAVSVAASAINFGVAQVLRREGRLRRSITKETVEMMYEFEKPFMIDSGKFEGTFGMRPTPIRQAIRETVAWYKSHPEKK